MGNRKLATGNSAPSAFTLMEVLIVVIVLGITVGLALPMLGDARQIRLREAARLLAADIEFAQNDSIAHADKPRTVKFDPANSRYWIAPAPPRDVPPAGAALPPIADEHRGTTAFSTGAGNYATELNARTLSNSLKSRFQNAGYALTADAMVYVQQRDVAWRVNDWGSSFLLSIAGNQLVAMRDEPFLVTLGSGRAAAAKGVTIDSVSSAYANEIRLDAYGGPDQTSDATVTLRCSGNTMIVRVSAGSGEVSIQ